MEREVCSGILFVSKSGKILVLKRSDEHGPEQYRGLYGLPGGHLDKGENHRQAAIRETKEEIDYIVEDESKLQEVNRQISVMEGNGEELTKEIDYTTFLYIVDYPFIPMLNKEHSEFVWANINELPEPLHPGLVLTLQKMQGDELTIAEMMQRGESTSPQKYMNVWLFDIRITGTGLSYRSGHKEFVWRDKSLYLNDRFLKRCQGLAVIFEHPKSMTLNTKEYVERNIGSAFLPYIKGDEVWAIVKVYDEFAAKIMSENILSTSPAVVLRGDDPKIKAANGENFLIEGVPVLLDHIAICMKGVWDKAQEARGIASVTAGDLVMADADDKAAALEAARKADAEAKAKKDADEAEFKKSGGGGGAGEVPDKLLKCLDSITSRMDAFEEKEKEKEKERADKRARKDAKKADKAKNDAEAKAKADAEAKAKADAEAKAKADADAKAKADAEAEVRGKIADMEKRLPKQMTDADYAAIADAQTAADRIYLMHGRRAPRPLDGQSLIAYRRRVANDLKEFSPPWKNIDLSVISDDAAFGNVEKTIYADAEHAGLHPPAPAADYLREIITEDMTGRKIRTFAGRPSAWMNDFAANKRILAGIRNHS
jgi:8-oxo-dGTP pyrophosphatase MutT (NUDIX family)